MQTRVLFHGSTRLPSRPVQVWGCPFIHCRETFLRSMYSLSLEHEMSTGVLAHVSRELANLKRELANFKREFDEFKRKFAVVLIILSLLVHFPPCLLYNQIQRKPTKKARLFLQNPSERREMLKKRASLAKGKGKEFKKARQRRSGQCLQIFTSF